MAELVISSIRSRFPVLRKKIYLNSCSQGALSDKVDAAFQEYLRTWHGHGSPWDLWVQHYEVARTVFARLIGAETDEVALMLAGGGLPHGRPACLSGVFRPQRTFTQIKATLPAGSSTRARPRQPRVVVSFPHFHPLSDVSFLNG